MTICYEKNYKNHVELCIAFYKLYRWIERENFVGYDPYDGLNTKLKFLKTTKIRKLLLTYLNKNSFINLRRIIGIDKKPNMKALALISRALLYKELIPEREKDINFCIQNILSKSLIENYGYHCWYAHSFPVQTTGKYQATSVPGIIGSEACAAAILDYYCKNKENKELEKILLSVKEFFINKLLVNNNDAVFFKYHPNDNEYECTYNASLIAARYIAKLNWVLGIGSHKSILKKCYRFIQSRQKSNGSWALKIDLRSGKEKVQIDFHQGYILDSILDYLIYVDWDEYLYETYRKGLKFYHKKQFNEIGKSVYRFPRKYPIDIHNQAQGIITFSRAEKFDPEYKKFAKTIGKWTVDNMQSPLGFFYYQKYPILTNKIPYLRWAQAWMLYALSHIIEPEGFSSIHLNTGKAGSLKV